MGSESRDIAVEAWFKNYDREFYFQGINSWEDLPSVLRRCWLGGRKGIRPVKN